MLIRQQFTLFIDLIKEYTNGFKSLENKFQVRAIKDEKLVITDTWDHITFNLSNNQGTPYLTMISWGLSRFIVSEKDAEKRKYMYITIVGLCI